MNAENRADNARAEAALGGDALHAAHALLALGLHNDALRAEVAAVQAVVETARPFL